MRRVSLIHLTIAGALLGLSLSASAETLLTPHKAEYKVSVGVFGGQLNTELRTTEEGYVATHTIKTTGMSRLLAKGDITESSTFARESDGIRPQRFLSRDTLTRDKNRADIEFDWATGAAGGTVNGEAFASTMGAVAYDRVSIQYKLMSDLMNATSGQNYILFDVDELKTITVQNIGSRTVSVPAGEFEAIGVRHQTPGSKRVTTMWCVRELGYLPVIVEQHREGKLKMRAELRSYSPLKT